MRFANQLESLLEQAHIKLSSLAPDILGVSARRMLKAVAEGETDPAALATLADCRLQATPEQLADALGACEQLPGVYRRLPKMALEELKLMEEPIEQLDREALGLLQQYREAVLRVAEVPGFGVDSALRTIAEVGPEAAAFGSEKDLASWVGACPGNEWKADLFQPPTGHEREEVFRPCPRNRIPQPLDRLSPRGAKRPQRIETRTGQVERKAPGVAILAVAGGQRTESAKSRVRTSASGATRIAVTLKRPSCRR